ncbi:MAG: hypothetical protein EXR14_06045 [Pelagibacteraceae bacterium]|nr:hypothetical protein [Pelagibacteraceae bacterium]
MKNKTINESSFSDIDILAQESNDFREFVKEFYKEYKDFPKDKDTIKWLKSVYDNRSTSESVVNETFDKTHLGILQYAFKDIDRINPSEPAYKRLVDMLNKLSKQELQQIAAVDIKFLSLLAKNLLSKKESVNESHFQIGDKVKMSHGGVGVVKSLDKEDGADDEKYYNIELPNGEVMKHAPNELTLAETDLNESTVSIGDIVFFPPANSAATVVDRMGRSVTLKLANGKKVKTIINKVKLLTQDNVNERISRDAAYIHGILQSGQDATQNFIDDNGLDGEKLSEYVRVNRNNIDGYNVKHYISGERGTVGSVPKLRQAFIKKFKKGKSNEEVNEGNAFTGALFNARKEGLTEFEFNGKMYPVHKLEEEETPIKESKLSKSDLKKIIKEEYHNVKNFMEENYGFTPELGKVYSSLINKSFLKEQEKKNEGNESDSDMAVDQLDTSIRKAQELIAKLRGKGDLEPWVQSLITKAEDYISTVSDYSEVDEYDVENYEDLNEFSKFMNEYTYDINEAEYQGRKVKLGKVMQGDTKKFKVYVKNDKGNVVKVNFGQGGDAKGGTMRIRKDNPEARASFRARHNCDNPGPRYKARYWSCRQW